MRVTYIKCSLFFITSKKVSVKNPFCEGWRLTTLSLGYKFPSVLVVFSIQPNLSPQCSGLYPYFNSPPKNKSHSYHRELVSRIIVVNWMDVLQVPQVGLSWEQRFLSLKSRLYFPASPQTSRSHLPAEVRASPIPLILHSPSHSPCGFTLLTWAPS